MKITQIRNATITVEYNNVKFLIDPWLMPKDYMEGFEVAINSNIRQPRVELPFEIKDIVNIDAVIVTHIHPDHWDEFAKNTIDKNKKIFTQNEFDRDYLKKEGFLDVDIINEKGTDYKNISLYKINCEHGKRELVKPLCNIAGIEYDAMGVIFKSDSEKTLYILGDTIWCDEVNSAIDKFNPEIAVINGCEATLLNGARLIMGIEDTKKVLDKKQIEKVIISHMDTVSHLKLTRKDYEKFKKENNIEKMLIPLDGETIKIDNI